MSETAKTQRWYHGPDIPWRRALEICAVATLCIIVLYLSPIGESVQRHLGRPIEFRLRHRLGRDPKLDPRLVVYGIGDSTLEYLGSEEMTLRHWEKLFALLATRHPRAILVDKLFTTPLGKEDAPHFVKALNSLGVPIIAGAFASPLEIAHRVPIDPRREEYSLAHYGGQRARLPSLGGYIYGPHLSVRDAFAHIGHCLYDGDGFFRAFYRVDETSAVPGAPFFAAKSLAWGGDSLFVEGTRVPLDHHGRFLVNLPDPSVYYDRAKSVAALLRRIESHEAAPEISADSVVVILPALYTGHGDFVQTAYGTTSGGYVVASIVNSVLTGQWLSVMPAGWLAIVLFGAIGGLAGFLLRPVPFALTVFGMATAIASLGIASFSYFALELPWIFALFGNAICALAVFSERIRGSEERTRRLEDALTGSLSPTRLRDVLTRTTPLSLEPTGRVVSIMFIDIVGFSVAAERQTPKEAFLALRERLRSLAEWVHESGGVVDKMLGDGVLCFFGYHYDGSESTSEHADEALRCAIRIQKENVLRNILAQKKGEPVYPLRIGINTAAVYIGDLGSSRKIDLTLIGHGVNYAKRLESACDTDCIMIGATTRDMLVNPDGIGLNLKRRFVQIKHFSDLVEAYECDPFEADADTKNQSSAAYRAFLERDRRETRWPVPAEVDLLVSGNWGAGRLVNFSESGLAFRSDHYLGRGVHMNLDLDTADGALRARLNGMGLLPLLCEVRWGRAGDHGEYYLGVVIKNLNHEQRAVLLKELRVLAFGALQVVKKTG